MGDGLQKVRIEGFRSLRDVEFEPGRLTVLIGSNGSGKSNVLKAFRLIASIGSGSLQRLVAVSGGAASLLHYGPKRTEFLSLELTFEDDGRRLEYNISLEFSGGDRLVFSTESTAYGTAADTVDYGGGSVESFIHNGQRGGPATQRVFSLMRGSWIFHFHDTSSNSALRTNARSEDDRSLNVDGGNLAAYLLRLEQSEAEDEQKAWRRINRYVRQVVPSIKTLAPTEIKSSVRLDWIDDQDERFGVHQLSDGSLRIIALITALAQPTASLPAFITIDEPELGLHPAAITLLAALARSVSHHTQIMFATQSTEFLQHFEPHEVVVVERKDGESTLKRLDHDDLAGWLENYSLPELFNKGVIGGRP